MKNLKQLFTALLLLCTTVATAHDFEVDGIYYNIISEEDKTVEVTYSGDSYSAVANEYTASVVIPETVTYNSVTYSVTVIGKNAFTYCSGLTSIEIPNSVTNIENYAFSNCSGLTSVTIPNNVTSIGVTAFGGCTGLASITIPNRVISIGDKAFIGTAWYNRQPNGPVYLGKMFYEYKGAMPANTSVIIKEGTLGISTNAFINCTTLKSITIPNSVTTIGSGAFEGCTGLTSIEIPNSVTTIEKNAFTNCTGLEGVYISDMAAWCNIKFGSSNSNPLYYTNNLYLNGSVATELVIPEGISEIKAYAFYNLSSLKSVTIPNSVITIGNSAFYSCIGLTSVTIPNSVTSIGNRAFYRCTGLTSIEIPNSVTTIEIFAFGTCSSLTSIKIPNSVTTIGSSAFEGCTGLTSIEIPNSVTAIGSSAFSNCSSLTSIISMISAEDLFAINTYTFDNVDKNTCTLYVPYGAKETYATKNGWFAFKNIVELDPTEVTITINEYGSATYCSEFALDFSNVEGLKAYAATGYNTATQVVTLTRVQTAKEETGLFLMGEPGEYTVPVIENSNDFTLNLLVGTLESTGVNGTTDDGYYINFKYTIGETSDAPLFYQFEDNSTLSAGKAYLQLPATLFPAAASKSVGVRFDDGTTTDIEDVENAEGETQTVYDLQGRKVENPSNGIYIIDGKKVLVW